MPETGVPVPYLPPHMLLAAARTQRSGPLLSTRTSLPSCSYIKQAEQKQDKRPDSKLFWAVQI